MKTRTEDSGITVDRRFGRGRQVAIVVGIGIGVAVAFAATLAVPRAEAGAQASTKAEKATTETTSSGDAKKGQQLYTSSGCYECHGREGQGSRYSGARIGPPPISLSGFIDYIRQPAGQMPPYTSKVLSDAEVGQIYAFLKSIAQPPPAKSIPLLSD